MAREASKCLRAKLLGVEVNIEAVKEPQHLATGNGTGIMYVARCTGFDTFCALQWPISMTVVA